MAERKGKKEIEEILKKTLMKLLIWMLKSEEMGKGARLREIGGNGTIL